MRIAVLDDDIHEMNEFISALHVWDPTRSAECFNEGGPLLEAAKLTPHFSAAFLDIYLPMESGVEIAKQLKKISPETEIIFTTTSREFAVEAYSLNAVHYIVKPVTTEDIRESFYRITQKNKPRNMISLKIGRSQKLLYTDEIMTAASDDHRMCLKLKSGKDIYANISCMQLMEMLNEDFILIQRGFIVNAAFIDIMSIDSCKLQNGQTLMLSRKFKDTIHEQYNDYVFKRLSENSSRLEV